MAASGFKGSTLCTPDKRNYKDDEESSESPNPHDEGKDVKTTHKGNQKEKGKNVKNTPQGKNERKTSHYFLIHLHNIENSVSLWVRRCDLCILGFKANGMWFEYIASGTVESGTIQYEILNSVILGFDGSYPMRMSGQKGGAHNIKFGGKLLNSAIDHLRKFSRNLIHSSITREHLIRLIFVLMESCRFESINETVQRVFETENGEEIIGLENLNLCQRWEDYSLLVQQGKQLEPWQRLRIVLSVPTKMPSSMSNAGNIFPMVAAAHPSEPNQIPLEMSDGSVHVMEPLESDTKWGSSPAQDNGSHAPIALSPSITNPQSTEPSNR